MAAFAAARFAAGGVESEVQMMNQTSIPQSTSFGANGWPHGLVGQSTPWKAMIERLELVARTDSTVLVIGETGTGKELVARAIHRCSARRSRAFVGVNCAALPVSLLESELFGHERGAFTGAQARRVGRFELAHDGTLFLDEVGELATLVQPRLLRVLQERQFERVGGCSTIYSNLRLVAATHRDLASMCAARTFRQDLYYRLNVFPIFIPPLRERRDDIPLLVHHFVAHFAAKLNRRIPVMSEETLARLQQYDWPGNIRELQNEIERAVILADGPELKLARVGPNGGTTPSRGSIDRSLAEVNRAHLVEILRTTRGVVSGPNGAAARLGLKRSTLVARMKKLGVSPRAVARDRGPKSGVRLASRDGYGGAPCGECA